MRFFTLVSLTLLVTVQLGFGKDDVSADLSRRGRKDYRKARGLLHRLFIESTPKDLRADITDTETLGNDLLRESDGTEVSVNRKTANDLFEADILLTSQQAQGLLDGLRKGGRRWKRKVNKQAVKWELTIPYSFGAYDRAWRDAIRAGIRLWESHTCLRFAENGRGHQLRFIQGSGCYSWMGKTGGSSQEVSIGRGCEVLGIVAHEIGHALGFWHEQSRPDRDAYLYVNLGYVARGFQGNFHKRSTTEVDTSSPFDLGSVMHYGPKGFTIRRDMRTLDTKNQNYRNTIGQRQMISFIDVKEMNDRYCGQSCTGNRPLNCKHGGYLNPNNCYECKCPDGLGGRDCDRVQQSKSSCGGELVASRSWQELKPPTIGPNQECIWRITASGNIDVDLFELDGKMPCAETCLSYVELKYSNDFRQTGPRFCCKRPSSLLRSRNGEFLIIHRTDGNVGSSSGWKLKYRTDRGGTLPPTHATRPTRRTTRSSRAPVTHPTTTSAPRPGQCGPWGKWTDCSITCGGCGLKAKYRTCSPGGGSYVMTAPCASKACPGSGGVVTRPPTRTCSGILRSACSVIDRLTVSCRRRRDSVDQLIDGKPMRSSVVETPSDVVVTLDAEGEETEGDDYDYETSIDRRKRGVANAAMCVRRFYYQCGCQLRVSVQAGDNPNDKPQGSPPQRGIPTNGESCCDGYYASGGHCYEK